MALTRLKNIITSRTGRIIYVNPDDFDASDAYDNRGNSCLLYTSPSPRDGLLSRMPSSA